MNNTHTILTDKVKSNSAETDTIRVSPRHLGQMRRPDFCARCFWYSVALGFRHPFDMPMPGIMFNLDRFEKLLVEAQFKATGVGPKWLASLRCTGPVNFPAKMTEDLPSLGLTLVGMPDAVFSKKDGSLCLVDYKSAKFKGSDDPFMPIYETQLWGYARLLEASGVGKVTSAALVYFSNTLKDYEEKPLDLLTDEGISVPFEVKIHEVKLDIKAIDPLLKQFRRFADTEAPPEGVSGCKTCKRLDFLFDVEFVRRGTAKTVKDLVNRDSASMYRIISMRNREQRLSRSRESIGWESDLADSMSPDIDYRPAAWDC
jgi:hypothetical protein